MTHKEWKLEAVRRFGTNPMDWAFVCPSCGFVATVEDWVDAGASSDNAAFSCVGRWLDAPDENTFSKNGGPCQYAGGGLIGLNPVEVVTENGKALRIFDFAPEPEGVTP